MKNFFPLILCVFITFFTTTQLAAQITINEIDADINGTENAEFIELAGTANASLDGYIVVLFNGNGDAVYNCFDLDTYSFDANGFFVIGGSAITNADLSVTANSWLQNGADAVAVYQLADCPTNGDLCSTLGTTNLIDALVYGTSDPDDTDLLTCLGETTQQNEGSSNNDNSIQWNGTTYVTGTPSPGAANTTTCSITNVIVTPIGCSGPNFLYEVAFIASGGTANYDVVLDGTTTVLASGDSSPILVTVANSNNATPFDIVVMDNVLTTCVSTAVSVTPLDCSANTCVNVGDLVINEIMQNPNAVNNGAGEWFEVYNPTANPIDLMGIVLRDNFNNFHLINSSVTVAPNGYAVLAINDDMPTNGNFMADYQYTNFSLGNTSDQIILECGGVIIDEVAYDNTFPTTAGASMLLKTANQNAVDNNDGNNWCVSTSPYGDGDLGTPGAVNDACAVVATCNLGVGDIIITELMRDPVAVGDNDGEWIEIYNPGSTDVDLEGVILKDAGTESHTIASSVIVPAMSYVVLGRNGDVSMNGNVPLAYVYTGISLANGDDEVIFECNGVVIDSVYYDGTYPSPSGASMNLDSGQISAMANDNGANWCASTTPMSSGDMGTPGAANESCSSTCPAILTETGAVASGSYLASNLVETSGVTTVGATETVVFDAGNCVELNADFEVVAGADFLATIGGCTPLAPTTTDVFLTVNGTIITLQVPNQLK